MAGASVYVHETGEAIDDGKIVTVDTTGNGDFGTIAQAARYLRGFKGKQGGIISLKGGQTHQVSTDVDVKGMTIQSGDGGLPTIQAVTGGKLRVAGTRFMNIAFDVPAGFAGTYFLDKDANGIVDFLGCDFRPATGKYIMGSSAGGTVNIVLTVRTSGQSLQQGAMIDPAAVFTATTIYIQSTNNLGTQQYGVRPVTVTTDARYDTTGQITGVPVGYLTVAPGESIQSRLNSLAAIGGGECLILPGVHLTSTNIFILSNNITVRGSGPPSIIRSVAPWVGEATGWSGIIQIGRKSTATIVSRCTIHGIKIEAQVNPSVAPGDGLGVHAFMAYGGDDNKFESCSAEAGVAFDFYVTGHRTAAFLHTDSVSSQVNRPLILDCRVTSGGTVPQGFAFMDAFSVQAYNFVGNYGHGNRSVGAVIQRCQASQVFESCVYVSGYKGGIILGNTAQFLPWKSTGRTYAFYNCTSVRCVANQSYLTQPTPAAPPALIECFFLDGVTRSVFVDNIIDPGGTPQTYLHGFYLAYTGVGAPTIYNSYNIISHNVIKRCSIGIEISNILMLENYVGPNTYEYPTTVPTKLVDASVTSKYAGINRQGTVNPTGVVNGNFGDCYYDTVTLTMYKCNSWPQGTSWQVI